VLDEERKQAEVDYPIAIGEEGQRWLQTKPFANEPRETARHLIDAGYVIELLDLRAGQRFVELGWRPERSLEEGLRETWEWFTA